MEYLDGTLRQCGQKVWDHIDYKEQAMGIYKINKKYRMTKLCYDRSGVGDAAAEFLPKEVPMEEVVSTMSKKQEIINLIHTLAHNDKLEIGDKDLFKQILEQESYKSDAGNLLYRHPARSHDDIFWALGYACYAARNHFHGVPTYKMSRIARDTRMRKGLDPDFDDSWNVFEGF